MGSLLMLHPAFRAPSPPCLEDRALFVCSTAKKSKIYQQQFCVGVGRQGELVPLGMRPETVGVQYSKRDSLLQVHVCERPLTLQIRSSSHRKA